MLLDTVTASLFQEGHLETGYLFGFFVISLLWVYSVYSQGIFYIWICFNPINPILTPNLFLSKTANYFDATDLQTGLSSGCHDCSDCFCTHIYVLLMPDTHVLLAYSMRSDYLK